MSKGLRLTTTYLRIQTLLCLVFLPLLMISNAKAQLQFKTEPSSTANQTLSNSYQDSIAYLRDNPSKKTTSTSGLDKKAQKIELTQTILYIYDRSLFHKTFWTNFDDKDKVQAELFIDDEAYNCFIENHNYDFFATSYQKAVDKYVDEHSAKKVRDDLIVLIDSNLSIEVRNLLYNMTIKDREAIKLIDKRLDEDPYLFKAINMLEADDDLSTLLGMNTTSDADKSLYDLMRMEHRDKSFSNLDSITRHLMQVMLLCGEIK